MAREPLSVVVTTLNNAATLDRCLASVAWADEIVLLDSGSNDATLKIATQYRCRIFVEPFKGYGPQKQAAIDKATHCWVLLLDADEALAPEAGEKIKLALTSPKVAGFRLPRREQMFWTFQHHYSWVNTHLRLFDRRCGGLNDVPIHAAPVVTGKVATIVAELLHFGEPDIHTKVDKVNHYSSGLVANKLKRRQRFVWLRMTVYPPVFFLRQYVAKRYFLNGWAGFISAVIGSFYVFLKYAKLYEAQKQRHKKR